MRFALNFLLSALLIFLYTPSWAQNQTQPSREAEKPKAAPAKPAPDSPVKHWLEEEKVFADKLSADERETFFIIRNKHGVIHSVTSVHRDVGKAVKACGNDNPDLKDKMYGRFAEWEQAVLPILNSAEKFLKEEIAAQKNINPAEIRRILKLNDVAYDYQESNLEKRIVSDAEACNKLYRSMDRTEDDLVKLLQDMLLPEAVIRKRAVQENTSQEN